MTTSETYTGRTGVLLVNLGTPDSPKPSDVRRYLLEFLTDGRVIDYPWLARQLLVRGIIVPFRYRESAELYGEIWDAERGSPLMFHSEDLLEKVRAALPDDHVVELAMRYQHPSLGEGLQKLRAAGVGRIKVLPLFPQYASSTSGTIMEAVQCIVSKWNAMPALEFTGPFYDHPLFIRAFERRIRASRPERYDHVVFSYHGVPERHIRKSDDTGAYCLKPDYSCCGGICTENRLCYRAHCAATTRALVSRLGLEDGDWTMAFQSRLGKDPWIRPYTSEVLDRLASDGKRRVLVACPAFVADCIETIHEIGVEYKEEFLEAGGEALDLVESLNSGDDWVETVVDLICS